jgi:hypothetical protein
MAVNFKQTDHQKRNYETKEWSTGQTHLRLHSENGQHDYCLEMPMLRVVLPDYFTSIEQLQQIRGAVDEVFRKAEEFFVAVTQQEVAQALAEAREAPEGMDW